MAFGDLLSNNGNASTNPGTGISAGSVTVAVGDLAVVAYDLRSTSITVSISDNLGHTWTALTESSGSFHRLRAYYTIIQTAGTMTVSASHDSTTGDAAISVAVHEGPFAASPLDTNPAVVRDATSPHVSNSTGTLSQADELMIGYAGSTNGVTWTSTSPRTESREDASGTGSNTVSTSLQYRVVSATTALTASFETGSNQNQDVGVATFKKQTRSAAITGTATASITEADIVTGGKTIIITLTGDTFIAAGTGPIGSTANTQALIDGIDSAQSEANGWDAVVKTGIETTDVVRTSDTVATITLDPEATYNITAAETITVTVPAEVLTGAAQIVATPTFTVSPVTLGVSGSLLMMGMGS